MSAIGSRKNKKAGLNLRVRLMTSPFIGTNVFKTLTKYLNCNCVLKTVLFVLL